MFLSSGGFFHPMNAVSAPFHQYDLHLHSFFSDAQHDFDVIIEGLIDLGIKIIGFADHLFPGAMYHHSNSEQWKIYNMYSKRNLIYRKKYLEYLDKKYPEIKILNGAEINCWVNGHLTLPRGIDAEFFDYLSVSRHTTLIKPIFSTKNFPEWDEKLWRESPYRRWIKYMWRISLQKMFRVHRPDIFCHPQENIPLYMTEEEIKWFMGLLKKYGVAFELNHFNKRISRTVAGYILKWGKKFGVDFCLGSDFHGCALNPFMLFSRPEFFKRSRKQNDQGDVFRSPSSRTGCDRSFATEARDTSCSFL